MNLARLAMMRRLARWLGPWAREDVRPRVHRRCLRLDEGFDVWVYTPTDLEPSGTTLVVPGLHYLGPADVRLDRFNSVLAASGQVVACPLLPEFRRARVGPSLVDDTLAAYDAMLALPELPHRRPGLFSISFGSYPALHVAARRDPGALMIFGGYARFEDAIRFALEGDPGRPHDPLNPPVVFLNLLEHLPGVPEDREPLARAWTAFVRRTWGKDEMKDGGWRVLAREMSARLPDAYRAMFETGVGLRPGAVATIDVALRAASGAFAYLDPSAVCGDVRCPVTIAHGRDDDVIPYREAERLHADLPGSELFITGLYAHTGSAMVSPSDALAEGRAMLGILSAMADVSLRGSLPNGRHVSTDR